MKKNLMIIIIEDKTKCIDLQAEDIMINKEKEVSTWFYFLTWLLNTNNF